MTLDSNHGDERVITNRRNWRLAAGVAIIAVAIFLARDTVDLNYLASRESHLREFQVRYPIATTVIALAVYVAATGLSLPGAAGLSMVFGWYFGFWKGLFVVSFGSTLGATIALLLSRFLFRQWSQDRLGERWSKIREAFEREGAIYLFSLRLIPAVPFFVINVVMGLTNIPVWTFWWVSQIGMLPGTAAYVFAGASLPSLKKLADEGVGGILSWPLVIAMVALGLLPLVFRYTLLLTKHRLKDA